MPRSPRIRSTAVEARRRRRESEDRRRRPSPFVWGFAVTLGGGVGIAVLATVAALSTVLVYAGIALFLTLALEPLIELVTRRGLPRGAGVAASIVVVVGALLALLAYVVPTLATQAVQLVRSLPEIGREVAALPFIRGLDLDELTNQLVSYLSDAQRIQQLGGGLLSIGAGLVNGVVAVVTVAALTVYFAVSLPAIKAATARAVPASRRERFGELRDEIFAAVGHYVAGQVVLALLNAGFVVVVLLIAGAPLPVLLAVVAFVGALIPVVGTVVAYAIITATVLVVSPTTALVVGLVLLAYAQVEAYVLTPRVMNRAVEVPGALVILAAVGGSALGGVLGALVAVPVVASGLLLFQRVVVPAQDRR